jgi:hypothetical protein
MGSTRQGKVVDARAKPGHDEPTPEASCSPDSERRRAETQFLFSLYSFR